MGQLKAQMGQIKAQMGQLGADIGQLEAQIGLLKASWSFFRISFLDKLRTVYIGINKLPHCSPLTRLELHFGSRYT